MHQGTQRLRVESECARYAATSKAMMLIGIVKLWPKAVVRTNNVSRMEESGMLSSKDQTAVPDVTKIDFSNAGSE